MTGMHAEPQHRCSPPPPPRLLGLLCIHITTSSISPSLQRDTLDSAKIPAGSEDEPSERPALGRARRSRRASRGKAGRGAGMQRRARTGGGDKIHMERGKEKGGGEMYKRRKRRGLTSGDLARAAGLRHASQRSPASPTASRGRRLSF